MSKMYTSKKAGVSVLSGRVKSITPDGMSMVVSYQEYNYQAKTSKEQERTIVGLPKPVAEYGAQLNRPITVVGYIQGPTNFQGIEIMAAKDKCYEKDEIAILSGNITRATMNYEVDQNGSPKLKQDGVTPRKPHFDICLQMEEDGKLVNQRVKVYDSPQYQRAGEESNTEKMIRRFQHFENGETTPMRVTIVTSPGTAYSYTKDDGTIFNGNDHLGCSSLDIEYQFSLKKLLDAKNAEAAQTQTQEQQAPNNFVPANGNAPFEQTQNVAPAQNVVPAQPAQTAQPVQQAAYTAPVQPQQTAPAQNVAPAPAPAPVQQTAPVTPITPAGTPVAAAPVAGYDDLDVEGNFDERY